MAKQYISIQLEKLALYTELSGGALRLLLMMLRDTTYPSRWDTSPYSSVNKIKITPITKAEWATNLKLSVGSINNSVTELVKKGAIRKEDMGIYLLNPNMAYKGPTSLEEEAIKQFG